MSAILQENGSRILLEDLSGSLLQEAVVVVGPGTVTLADTATVTIVLTQGGGGTLTLKDGAS
jgi:hypothetical protein